MPCALELIAILQPLNEPYVKSSVVLYSKQVVSESEISEYRTCHLGLIYSLSIAGLSIHVGHRPVSCLKDRVAVATRFCNLCIKPFSSKCVWDKGEQNVSKELRPLFGLIYNFVSRNNKLVALIVLRNRRTNLTKLASKVGAHSRPLCFGLHSPQFWRDLVRREFPEAEGRLGWLLPRRRRGWRYR